MRGFGSTPSFSPAGPNAERYVGIPVRSEDDGLVIAEGHEVLSAGYLMGLEEVADLVGSRE